MAKHVFHLGGRNPCGRQRRKFVLPKKLCFARFQAFFGLPTAKLTHKEEFVDMVWHWGMPMFIPVVDRRQLLDNYLVSRLLLHFANGCKAGSIADLRPTTG